MNGWGKCREIAEAFERPYQPIPTLSTFLQFQNSHYLSYPSSVRMRRGLNYIIHPCEMDRKVKNRASSWFIATHIDDDDMTNFFFSSRTEVHGFEAREVTHDGLWLLVMKTKWLIGFPPVRVGHKLHGLEFFSWFVLSFCCCLSHK